MSKIPSILMLLCNFVASVSSSPGQIRKIEQVHLVPDAIFSGDEFLVSAADSVFRLKLQLAECPPLYCQSTEDSAKIDFQTCYWGLPGSDTLHHFARTASEYVSEKLNLPFTFYITGKQGSIGEDSLIYSFVKTSNGDFLSYLLVENGFACIREKGLKFMESSQRARIEEEIRDRELKAILLRNGIWSCTDPDLLIQRRAELRCYSGEDPCVTETAPTDAGKMHQLLDINTASNAELQMVKGIGPQTAERIIAGRPYHRMDDLLRVKGIGPKTLQKLKANFNARSTAQNE